MAPAWTEEHARRLLWRAGFGGAPAEVAAATKAGNDGAIAGLFSAPATLKGPAPTVDGKPIDPANEWAHDALWWLDRMVRTQRPLEEKLTLFWHDHFATADQNTPLMLAQNRTLRARGLGNFRALLGAVMRDPAMQLFLSLANSSKDAPNENFARELMELFTLGSGYTESDVREAARALTGFEASYGDDGDLKAIGFDPGRHDDGRKTIFGKTGRFGPDDVLDLVVAHPAHAPFLVTKLWSFFVTDPPSRATTRDLVARYRAAKGAIAPVVEAILSHPALYARLDAPDMVKSPVVLVAGVLRATQTPVTIGAYGWLLDQMGQMPFRPPSVAGWESGPAWLSTGTMRARATLCNAMLGWGDRAPLHVGDGTTDPAKSAADQLEAALDATGRPWISEGARAALTDLAAGFYSDMTASWQQKPKPRQDRTDMLQRLLRHLLLSGPDNQLH